MRIAALVVVLTCWLLLTEPAGSFNNAPCSDKRDDCGLYTGSGPKGGGCERHPEYMRIFCRRTCGLCGTPDLDLKVEGFVLAGTSVQAISSRGARSWCFFELPVSGSSAACDIGGPGSSHFSDDGGGHCEARAATMRTHVAMAHYYDSQSHMLNSSILRWDQASQSFAEHQAVPTVGAWDLAAFELEGHRYLAIASFFDGHSRELNSTLLRWDMEADAFVPHQSLPTLGAMDVEAVVLSNTAVLAFTGNHDGHKGDASVAECRLFVWRGGRFEHFQTIETSGGYDAEAFTIEGGGTVLLIVVHERSTDIYSSSVDTLQQHEGEPAVGDFALLQRLDVPHGRDAEHFFMNNTLFLALAIFRDSTSYQTESLIYTWDSQTRRFAEVHRIPSHSAFDVEFLTLPNEQYRLLMASQRTGATTLYSWSSEGWFANETFSSRGVYDVSWHIVREVNQYYLGVARFWE